MKSKLKHQIVAYLRTSSATHVGADKDSDKRQRAAIDIYARSVGAEIVDEFYDEAVSGADAIETRPGFAAMLQRLLSNGCRTIVVETANRFARDLIIQETGYEMLKARGITLIAADKPDAFLDDGPTATLIRQVLGAVSQFEKAMMVNKLRGARDRKRATGAKVEGRKSHAEKHPEVVALARQLRRKRRKAGSAAFARSLPNCSPPATLTARASRSRRNPSKTCWRAQSRPACPARHASRIRLEEVLSAIKFASQATPPSVNPGSPAALSKPFFKASEILAARALAVRDLAGRQLTF